MQINAEIIEGIKYKSLLKSELKETSLENLDINSEKSSCIIISEQNRFALSKWVSPKRTRSYPYERVYNTLGVSKRITIIPVVKDEGAAGDRDFLQWDTISLMSLLDVFVILSYYEMAEKHCSRENKITNQKFNNVFIVDKIREINSYHSSALHWNLKELKNISAVLEKAKKSYENIAAQTLVKFHRERGLANFKSKISESLNAFMESSRLKAEAAQNREFLTVQPKEILATISKAKITITNYLGGKYFFTVDETEIKGREIYLIESKHTKSGKLPSIGDIKDGLLKMMLYTNLENVKVDAVLFKSFPVLRLTSGKLVGFIDSNADEQDQIKFAKANNLAKRQTEFISQLFAEANENNFLVTLGQI